MTHIEIPDDLYPELLIAALRDEMRRAERQEMARDAARRRRAERRAALRSRVASWLGRG